MTESAPDTSLEALRGDVPDVRRFWECLGLPGLFDVHVHFLPPRIQAAVYAVFDAAGPQLGRPWPIRYRVSVRERVTLLREMGVRRFSALPYAHKPGVATFMNDWADDFAADVPESLWSATFYPEAGAAAYVVDAVTAGVEVFKLHQQVGEFHLDDELLRDVWGILEDAGTPIVVHAGSGPVGNAFTGPASMATVLERHPRLAIVVAHMGAPECEEFLELAERFERVCLDTTMMFTDFFDHPYPPALLPRVGELGRAGRVLLGSDVPTIPYPYAHQLDALARLDLGDDWLRAVCWENGVRLFGLHRGGHTL